MMPRQFVDAYEALVVESFNSGGGMDGMGASGVEKADGRAIGQWRVGSGEVTSIGAASPISVKQVGKTARTMRNEAAFRLKVKIDKRLRGLAREVLASINESDKTRNSLRVCSGRCKKIGDPDWCYCPRCGGPMVELDER